MENQQRILSVIPAEPGWRAVFSSEDRKTHWATPIVGWALVEWVTVKEGDELEAAAYDLPEMTAVVVDPEDGIVAVEVAYRHDRSEMSPLTTYLPPGVALPSGVIG